MQVRARDGAENDTRQTAAPFHVIIWDNSPLRLAEALSLLERAPDDAVYYATPERVFSARAAASTSN